MNAKLGGEKKLSDAAFKKAALEIEEDRLFEETCGGYSFDRYGEANWRASIRMLLGRGFGHREIQSIMLSKWARWAGDAVNKDSGVGAKDLAAFMDSRRDVLAEVADLVDGTFALRGEAR